MRRRLIGILAAVALAGLGTLTLVHYVRGAEDRALAGEELQQVYVARSTVPAGTPAAELPPLLDIEQIPAKIRPTDAVIDLSELSGTVTAVDLVPGEQLLRSRLVDPADQPVAGRAAVPEGLVEVTVDLSPTRAVGGRLEPGDTVAVLSSFPPFDLSGAVVEVEGQSAPVPAAGAAGKTPNTTHVIVQQVLVTGVQTSGAPPGEEQATQVPGGNLLVTLAVTPADAERVVFTAEFGTLWLAAETGAHIPGGTSVQSRGSVYQPTPALAR